MPLYTRATIKGSPRNAVLKVTTLDDFLTSDRDPGHCALWCEGSEAFARSRVADLFWGAVINSHGAIATGSACAISSVRDVSLINPGDVIGVRPTKGLISSLYRRGSRNNALLMTERCNSYCVMCSQPPQERDESGHIDELAAIIRLADPEEDMLGVTGGEPTLFPEELLRLFAEIRTALPRTGLHILSNGRRFEDRALASHLIGAAPDRTIWAIPLYTDAPEVHDYVVQSRGAFAETVRGLWHLAGLGAHVELRIVLQRATIPRLVQFAHFVARNLSFVDHVAWMGLEPMGFAKPNWSQIWVEPELYARDLTDAIATLDRFGMATSIFNVPLCLLPSALRPYAAQSISDWKRDYLPVCGSCSERERCGGFFASAIRGYLPQAITPFKPLPADSIVSEVQ